ncbi:MAG TPA: SRPBCC family protein [Vicinamibacterales bacterium]|nr:SRPBCC family protein [Vicinamibacterales bacterium]
MNSNAAMLTGMGLGAVFAYLLDPAAGRKRRAMMRQSMVRAAHKSSDAAGAVSRSPTTRLLVGLGAVGMVGAAMRRRDWAGAAFTAAGALLLARAATHPEVKRLVGIGAGRRAVDLQKTITIHAPVADVFAFWLNYDNFPRFMSHVREVHAAHEDGRSHWVVDGPAGVPIEFDAVTTEFMPNEVIAWKTVEGSPVAHAGVVRFEAVGEDATRLTVRFSSNPPAGGRAAAWLLAADAERLFDDDLARLKTMIETGRPPRDAARPETGQGMRGPGD